MAFEDGNPETRMDQVGIASREKASGSVAIEEALQNVCKVDWLFSKMA